MKRRSLLKTLGLTLGAGIIQTDILARIKEDEYLYELKSVENLPVADKMITAVILGAGNRGSIYGNYASHFPKQLKIIGVAEPVIFRNDRMAAKHGILAENRFDTWEKVFEIPKFADAIIISTPDYLHYAPCMKALEMGYDILLEKPIAPTEKECRSILAMAKKTGRIVGVCHVLRYAPYFVKMKEMLDKGAIGEVISIQHFEPVYHVAMAHSYVRGNWHDSKKTTPMILGKSCHDLDIMRWMLNKSAKKIVAMGDLKWFRKENAPAGSTERCTGACKVERECPYSAIKEYYERRSRISVLDIPAGTKEQQGEDILEKLKTSDYGRCVYQMDNDQPDHYITSIQFDNHITASFSMEAFTSYHGRRTRIMGSMGDMVGDMEELVINDFHTRKATKFIPKAEDVEGYKNSGHGGGDFLMVRDFVYAVAKQDATLLSSTIDQSIESHIMGFMAEKSRKNGKVMDIKM